MSEKLDFSHSVPPEETGYIEISLDSIKAEIICTLSIVEVAKKLGLKLKELSKKAKEREEYDYSPEQVIYKSSCPQCKNKSSLRIFPHGTFGCINCERSGEYCEDMNVFELTNWVMGNILRSRDNYEGNKSIIQKLFELFPEDLGFLKGKNLNRYIYKGDFFELAEGYYEGIENDLVQTQENWGTYSRLLDEKIRNRDTSDSGSIREDTRNLERICNRLHYTIEAYKVVSDIYARREKVYDIIYPKSLEEVLGYNPDEEIEETRRIKEINDLLQEIVPEVDESLEEITIITLQEEHESKKQEEERLRQEEVERLVQEQLEQEKQAELTRRKKEENIKSLLGEVANQIDAKTKLLDYKLEVAFEDNLPLKVGDFGKFIVIIREERSIISIIFSKQKSNDIPPNNIKEIYMLLANMPRVGIHKDISIPELSERFGGGQYIMLPDNIIVIGGRSVDYGEYPREIVEKALEQAGYTVFFIDDVICLKNRSYDVH